MQEFLISAHAAILVTLFSVAIIVLFLRVPLLRFVAILPYRVLSRFLRVFGLYKSRNKWSVVYDSQSKVPIDPAYVTVRNPLGTIVASAVTDLDGRFNVLLRQGTYTIDVQKTNYVFPSSKLFGKQSDGRYEGLYFGDKLYVPTGTRSIAVSIPMDPIAKDWNQREKRRRNIFFHTAQSLEYRDALHFYYVVGLYLSFLRFILISDITTFRIFFAYALVGVLGVLWYVFMPKEHYHSVVIRRKRKTPVSFARVHVYTAKSREKVAEKTTSLDGQFVCLVPKGKYYLTIEERDAHGVYQPVYTTQCFTARHGTIARTFAI